MDISHWKAENSAAKWATKKIATLEALAEAGKWEELEAALYVSKSKSLNQYQKGLLEAQANLKAKAATNSGIKSTHGWTKLTGSLGTEVGGKYADPDGIEWYVKTPDNVARARNEALALELYKAAGAGVVDGTLVDVGGKLGVATEWMDGSFKANWDNKGDRNSASEDFAVHAWLGNWDAVGAGSENPMDNIKYDGNGVLRVVDAGGSLDYKGMGGSGTKPFGLVADEWDTMRDASINPSAAKVFGGMTPQQLVASTEKLKGITEAKVTDLVEKLGNGSAADKAEMVKKLMSRKNDLIARGINLKQSLEVAPDIAPVPAPVAKVVNAPIAKPSIPEPPVIASPKNQSYQVKINEIHAAAMTGDVAAVEALETNATSSQTYAKKTHKYKMAVLAAMGNGATAESTPAPKSKPKASAPVPTIDKSLFPDAPIFETSNAANKAANDQAVSMALKLAAKGDLEGLKALDITPSPKVQSFHAELVANVYKQLNPPPPPEKLADSLPELVAKLKSLPKDSKDKVGYWAVLGSAPEAATDPGGAWLNKTQEAEWFAKGHNSWKGLNPPPPNGPQKIKHYTSYGFGNINEFLRGKTKEDDYDAHETAQALIKASLPIPAGTKLSRKYIPEDGIYPLNKLKPGHIVADKGILSTQSTINWSGNVAWELTAAEGAKGLPANSFSANKGEYEWLLPPNTRMLVTHVEVDPGNKHAKVKAIILPFDEGQWP